MRRSFLVNEQLEQMSKAYRNNAADQAAMTWPNNSERYREAQTRMAEVVEELLDRRRAAGE